jgi:hypothetical protein
VAWFVAVLAPLAGWLFLVVYTSGRTRLAIAVVGALAFGLVGLWAYVMSQLDIA